MDLFFTQTNETLNAIIVGLEVSSKDIILAVGGSGDQAFALLEYAERVKVVDDRPEQLSYIRRRAEALQKGDYEAFQPSNREVREDNAGYFKSPTRLETIQKKLEGLIILQPSDIISLAQQEESYSKVYLSNVIGYRNPPRDGDSCRTILQKVAQRLVVNGLIYVANHRSLALVSEPHTYGIQDLHITSFLPPKLVLDLQLSKGARRWEKTGNYQWRPAVYRKVA